METLAAAISPILRQIGDQYDCEQEKVGASLECSYLLKHGGRGWGD